MTATTYRKTGKGAWVAFGPAEEIRIAVHDRTPLAVTKRDGTSDRVILRPDGMGCPFKADGLMMAYGYIDRDATAALRPRTPAASGPSRHVRAASRAYGTDMAEYGSGFGRDERAAFGGAR